MDARRDLDDVEASFIDVHQLNKMPYGRLDTGKVTLNFETQLRPGIMLKSSALMQLSGWWWWFDYSWESYERYSLVWVVVGRNCISVTYHKLSRMLHFGHFHDDDNRGNLDDDNLGKDGLRCGGILTYPVERE